jgi:NADH:ubiquinone oxidoreductase subunit 3 (subunit A)
LSECANPKFRKLKLVSRKREAVMPSQEESRETGRALIIVGWILVLFALLVMFFEPAAAKLGQIRFGVIAGAMVVVGLLLSIYGYRLRRRSF